MSHMAVVGYDLQGQEILGEVMGDVEGDEIVGRRRARGRHIAIPPKKDPA
jgi:hypothetical protein